MRKSFFMDNIQDYQLIEKYFSLRDFKDRLDTKKIIDIIKT